jgi:oxygen-independent coproporphyrinogen III oxidase
VNVQNYASEQKPLGLYVHAPFCSSTCDFCAFYQEKPRKNSVKKFLVGLNAEWNLVFPTHSIDTIFLGGGTPGALSEGDLERLCAFIRDAVGDDFEEWSVELAPSEITPAKLRILRQAGVTRLSLGVQSFQPSVLAALGRTHPPERARQAFDWMRDAGFDNLNLDLIFGAPGQELDEWCSDLETAVAWEPDHLSTYCLIYEEKAALFAQLKKGEIGPDPEREERFYRRTWDFLAAAGFQQYEVANFARDGKRCLHNWNVWRMNEWIGLGPSAASQRGGERWSNPASLDRWSDALTEGRLDREEVIDLGDREIAEDYLLFGLRLNDGIDLGVVSRLLPEFDLQPIRFFLQRLASDGLIEEEDECYAVTDRGRLVVDRIGAEITDRFDSISDGSRHVDE